MRIEIPPELRHEMQQEAVSGDTMRRRVTQRKQAFKSNSVPIDKNRYTAVKDPNFQQLFQSVYDAAVITNSSGNILDANARAEEFFNCKREDFGQNSVLSLISGADESLLETLRINLKSDRFTLIQAFCQRLDGSLFPAEISVNRLQLSGRDYLCFFVRDVTLRREAEETVRTVHNAIHNSGNGIAITNVWGSLQYVNPATVRIWGFTHENDILRERLHDLWIEEKPVSEMVTRVLQGESWTGELTARHHGDGHAIPMQVSAAANHDADDQLAGMVFSFIDVSDRKRAEQMEREAERQRVMLESIGAACHHLGQPATVLLASLGMMQKRESLFDFEMRSLLRQGIDSAEKLQSILHRLNTINEYRTVQYLGFQPGDEAADGDHILDL